VAPQLQLPAQPEDDLPQPARLRRRRALRRHHHHEHGHLPKRPGGPITRCADSIPAAAPPPAPPRPRYFAVLPAGFAAGAAAFVAACAGAAFFAGSFFAGAFFAAGGTASASAVRSTTESSPPKSLAT
jgi:hypothetical protein